MTAHFSPFDPRRDLVLQRDIAVPRDRVWAAWTEPERLKRWFTPAPWQTVDVEVDLRPGGIFRTVMRSPEGVDQPPNLGCYLDIVPGERLVWTSLMEPGYRPAAPVADGGCHGLQFTAVITLQDHAGGTRYRALVMHPDEDSARRHEEMGFSEGWGTTLDQLVALYGGSRN
ncbi:MAG TPA: SRPBCC family protein [Tahibacter sp.]|uniref:SRPBCC family protein n=1 Tax=Tahibacter sp. TaxID=2056211 RepID=UPI002C3555A3|nr:SRPBCC family protein [Tahibacter sp.]HSX60804.1 SRPBCC family protein [Tahibacter sp.]